MLDAETDEGEMIWLIIAKAMQDKKIEKLIRTSFTVLIEDTKILTLDLFKRNLLYL